MPERSHRWLKACRGVALIGVTSALSVRPFVGTLERVSADKTIDDFCKGPQ